MATMHVDIVAVERRVWSGEATMFVARTTEGEIGVMPGHIPLLAQLQAGHAARIHVDDGTVLGVAIHGGFLAVNEGGVSVLAEGAELSTEIDVARAQAALQRAHAAGLDNPDARADMLRAQARLYAVEG